MWKEEESKLHLEIRLNADCRYINFIVIVLDILHNNLVDSASSHMLVSKIKPCMSSRRKS